MPSPVSPVRVVVIVITVSLVDYKARRLARESIDGVLGGTRTWIVVSLGEELGNVREFDHPPSDAELGGLALEWGVPPDELEVVEPA